MAAETREATKHEALINLAFSGTPAAIMCLYDAAALAPAAISEARCTHPAIVQDGQPLASADFAGPGFLPPQCHRPLPVPPSSAAVLHLAQDLLAGVPDQELAVPRGVPQGVRGDLTDREHQVRGAFGSQAGVASVVGDHAAHRPQVRAVPQGSGGAGRHRQRTVALLRHKARSRELR